MLRGVHPVDWVPFFRLCLSITDFHPDTWNPAWSVSTILTGLLSFMVEKGPTLGSIETSDFTVSGGGRGAVRSVSTAGVRSRDGDSSLPGFHVSPVSSRGQVWHHQRMPQEGNSLRRPHVSLSRGARLWSPFHSVKTAALACQSVSC